MGNIFSMGGMFNMFEAVNLLDLIKIVMCGCGILFI